MAHEYAHIVDYKYGVLNNVGSKKTELFADYLAGFYMYHRVANGILTDVSQCLNSFESLGDTDFGSETHHGTPQERRSALFSGYNRAHAIHQTKAFIPLTEIIEEGKSYIKGIEDSDDDVIIIK
jgi:predicted metalloprotease